MCLQYGWLSIISHPIFLRAKLSHLIRCILGTAAAYCNKCTHCKYTVRISVRVRTYLRDKAWYSDTGMFAIHFAVSYYSCRMNGTWAGHPELRPPIYRHAMPQTYAKASWSDSFPEYTVKASPLLVEKNTYHDRQENNNTTRDEFFSLSILASTCLWWHFDDTALACYG